MTHLGGGFADPGKNHLGRIAASGQDTVELAAGDDVEAASCRSQGLQDGQIGIGFHRETDQMIAARQCTLVGGSRVEHRGA